ncbi:hypothetical protein [Reyranella massiliensis]|uniref:hypothetical protein n=1 Tax=Reyranella massiliensis TaxID=445220 RepID=UPI0005C29D4F|nr:hypothetical protein [Reyranella massiliensis]
MPDTLVSTQVLSNRRPPKAGPSKSVRELWNACQDRWKDIADASKACDAAMRAGDDKAEQEAEKHMATCSDAYDTARTAFLASPARTVDDAVCKIAYLLDQTEIRVTHADELREVLRVLQKLN